MFETAQTGLRPRGAEIITAAHKHPFINFGQTVKVSGKTLSLAVAVILAAAPLGCSSGQEDQTQTAQASGTTTAVDNTRDRAARLAAQTQLRNAQTDEAMYFTENQTYAPTAVALKTADPRLSPKVKVVRGDAASFEISITADDSQGTVYIIRTTGPRTDRVDGSGNNW